MAFGGIPYYLNYVQPGLSAEQNIQQMLFDKEGPLRDEFDLLFASLFKAAEAYVELVTLLEKKKSGVTRAELVKTATLSRGGGFLTDRLQDLVAAGFIKELTPLDRSKGEYYKLIDPFSLFHLRWIRPVRRRHLDAHYWTNQADMPAYSEWSGYAFETVCLQHIHQILEALRIPAGSSVGSWRYFPRKSKEN